MAPVAVHMKRNLSLIAFFCFLNILSFALAENTNQNDNSRILERNLHEASGLKSRQQEELNSVRRVRRSVHHLAESKNVKRRYLDSLGGGEIPLFDKKAFDSLGGGELPLFDRRSFDSLGGAELPLYKRKIYNSYGGKEVHERGLHSLNSRFNDDSFDNDDVDLHRGMKPLERKRYLDSLGGGELPIFKKRNV